MKTVIELLQTHEQVSDYKINLRRKESYELFFVKGKVETVRCTDTCDQEVTVYVDHGGCRGHAQFFVYPSTTEEQIKTNIDEAVEKALLIDNPAFTLPAGETGDYVVESNFSDYEPAELAAKIANAVFAANDIEHAALNSVEVFVNRHTATVQNSRGLSKTQLRYTAMVEAIPTYNGETQSVELYQDYSFNRLDEAVLRREIASRLAEVKARYEAVRPDFTMDCPVILNKMELMELFWSIADHLDYASVYGRSGLFQKGDRIQKAPESDRIGITMAGQAPGSCASSRFDVDGVTLERARIVEDGRAVGYYGANRFGQYLGETPTGILPCLCVDPGSAAAEAFRQGTYFEVLSMSGLQVDFYSDYIGGEVRLAYYHDGTRTVPVTGVSVSGSLSDVLNRLTLSAAAAVEGSYVGPEKALLRGMKIF